MSPSTTEHSPWDHNEYSCRPKTSSRFPAVPPDCLISLISPFEFYAHASFWSDNWRSIMATLFLGVGFLKITLDTDPAPTPRESHFCDGRNISTIIAAESNNSSAAMRQVLEEIQNHKHILQEHISFLQECDIRTAHPHSMDYVISTKTRKKLKVLLGKLW